MARLSERLFIAASYFIVFAFSLFLSLPALSYYWFADDFFLIRTYTNQELIAGFVGNWDPSGLVTASWRPFSRVFYHFQALLFGENIELYRLFNIALLALHVTVLMMIARQLKLSRKMVLIAAILIVCTKNTWWMMVWPTDGLRAPMGLLGSLAILLLILYLRQPALWKFGLSLLCFALALLTREEILFYAAVIPAVAFMYLLQRDDVITQPKRWLSVGGLRSLLKYTVVICVMTGAYWIVRGHLVPQSPTALSFEGFLFQVVAVLFPHLAAPTYAESAILIGIFWLALIIMLCAIEMRQRLLALFWLGCVLVACTPGLSSWRANNLLLAIGFFALFLATVIVTFAQRSRLAGGFCAILLVGFIGGSAYMHRLAQESIDPYSLYYISVSDSYLWGKAASGVPQQRLDHLHAEYTSLWINSEAEFQIVEPQLARETADAGSDHPDGDKPFLSWYPTFLYPW